MRRGNSPPFVLSFAKLSMSTFSLNLIIFAKNLMKREIFLPQYDFRTF
ncbi:hypothetical protein CWATWH0005_3613 [Crocosphaera watsonii WH 0005]|uniref:Uncharacterized protein n=1 Tax=Crocosphaera watsonii WH 0005 TaxID=423472 RepID=T2IMQ1_CROWT|nr:hypothetical protein CWATWH0005_3613 [Crocosphaera watsonii WH 0005]